MNSFQGLIPAAHTPFHKDGRLHTEKIADLTALFKTSGATATFIGGTTGESHSLSVSERQRLAEAWMTAADSDLPVLVHVGHNSQADAVELARHAQAVGAAAISALAPSYFKPVSPKDLIDFLIPVAAAAPELPFYYYDIPGMTGVQFPTDQFLIEASRYIPTLVGCKYSGGNLMMLQSCLATNEARFDILFGSDEILLGAYVCGVRGAVGSTYNYAAPLYVRMLEAIEAGDLETARQEQLKSVELVQALLRYGIIPAGKAILKMMGIDCGPPRLPLRTLTTEESVELYNRIRHLDIFARPIRQPE